MKNISNPTDSIKEFYFDLFDTIHSKDSSLSWIKNLFLMVTYPSKDVLISYLNEWNHINHIIKENCLNYG